MCSHFMESITHFREINSLDNENSMMIIFGCQNVALGIQRHTHQIANWVSLNKLDFTKFS